MIMIMLPLSWLGIAAKKQTRQKKARLNEVYLTNAQITKGLVDFNTTESPILASQGVAICVH